MCKVVGYYHYFHIKQMAHISDGTAAWMLCYHLGTKGNTPPQKFMQTYAKMFA